MTAMSKTPEKSVTNDIIRRVHLTLADMKTGDEVLNFLKATEPIFMDEVTRFIQTEMNRMRYQLTETQAMYISSVIGASYIAGFLIAREATHQMFNGLISFKSDITSALSQPEIDKIIDSQIQQGKTYKQISKTIHKMLNKGKGIKEKKKKSKKSTDNDGLRLDIGDLE